MIKGERFNCNYNLEPKTEMMTIDGENEADILKCARHILRIISKNQDWGFYYNLRVIKTTKETSYAINKSSDTRIVRKYETTIDIPLKAGVDKAPVKASVLLEDIINEYELPFFFDLLFQEALFNKSIKKFRVAFLLAFSALERAIKLVCEHHCQVKEKPINVLLNTLVSDKFIHLNVNMKVFNKFRVIRNDIAHGGTQFQKLKDSTKRELLEELFQELDKMFNQLSMYLIKYEKHL